MDPYFLPPITGLSEAMVTVGLSSSFQRANRAIKSGRVFVNGIRVANTNALLVITGLTTLTIDDGQGEVTAVTIAPFAETRGT